MVGQSINSYWDRKTQIDSTLLLGIDSNGELLTTEVINPLATSNSIYYGIWGTLSRNSGKWYWECVGDIASNDTSRTILFGVGIAKNDGSIDVPSAIGSYSSGGIKQQGTVYRTDGIIESGQLNSTDYSTSLTKFTIGVLLDLDNNVLTIDVEGRNVLQTVITPGSYFPFITMQRAKVISNFGDLPFNKPIPAGFRPFNCPPSPISPNVVWNITSQTNSALSLMNDINGDLLIAEVNDTTATPFSSFYSLWASVPKIVGKWYWEYNIDVSSTDPHRIIYLAAGIARNDGSALVPDISGTFANLGIKETKTVYRTSGEILKNGATNIINTSTSLEPFTMGFLLDMDNHTFNIRINNISVIFNKFVNNTVATAEYYPYIAIQRGKVEANFGSKTLKFIPPIGFQRYKISPQHFIFSNNTNLTNNENISINSIGDTIKPSFSKRTVGNINTYTQLNKDILIAFNNADSKITTTIVMQPIISGRIKG